MADSDLKVAVIGVGHLGKEHARVYSQMPGVELVAVVDADEERGRAVAETVQSRYYPDFHEVLDLAEAASIVVPTTLHAEVAEPFLEKGISLLVEKPMTRTIEEADRLLAASERSGAKLQVGHIERFNPAVLAAEEYISTPRFVEAHRISPYSFRSTDVGVVLDLMIHDLDILLHLVKSPVKTVHAIAFPVLSAHEDLANARIVFENGTVANLTASRVSPKRLRRIRMFQEDAYISLDYQKRKVLVYRRSPGSPSAPLDRPPPPLTGSGDLVELVFNRFISVEEIPMPEHEPLQKELQAFVDCVVHDQSPAVSGAQAREAVAVATMILESAAGHTWDFTPQKTP